MLYSYVYQPHPIRKLHIAVSEFFRALYLGNLDPNDFNIETCCQGELLVRARRSQKLREKLGAFYAAWFQLSQDDRRTVYRAFLVVNSIKRQLANEAPRVALSDLPAIIREPTRGLFDHLYKQSLVKAQVKEHWRQFYEDLPIRVCPFCGIEILHHPFLFKQDYDHVLCKDIYPFAAVNLRNLVPCGRDCNSIFKHGKDVIFTLASGRRKAFYPFQSYGIRIEISLAGSRLPTHGGDPGQWTLRFEPDTEEVRTWVDVFELERRYKLDVFGEYYTRWIDDFVGWIASQATPNGGWLGVTVRERMERYAESLQSDELRDQKFLRHALFAFILSEAEESVFAAIAARANSINN